MAYIFFKHSDTQTIFLCYSVLEGGETMEKRIKHMRLPINLIADVEKYRQNHYLPTFTAAAVQLIAIGLKAESRKDKTKNK